MNRKSLKIVHDVDVAIKSYVISILIGSTFDGFIDCSNIVILWRTLIKILTSFTNQTVFKCSMSGRSNDKIEKYIKLSLLQCPVGMEIMYIFTILVLLLSWNFLDISKSSYDPRWAFLLVGSRGFVQSWLLFLLPCIIVEQCVIIYRQALSKVTSWYTYWIFWDLQPRIL